MTKMTTKQRVDLVIKEYCANDKYLITQKTQSLRTIINSIQMEIGQQKNLRKKQLMQIISQQSQNLIDWKQTQRSQRIKNLSAIKQLKQSKAIISNEAIVAAIVAFLQGLLIYFQNNDRNDWFTTLIKILIILFVVLFFIVIGYNYCCSKKIQQDQFKQLQQTADLLTKTPEKK